MKLLFFSLIAIETCLIIVAISPVSSFINMSGPVLAYDAWQKHPTAENEAVWLKEKAAMKHKQLLENVCVYSLLVINAIGLIALFRKLKRQTKLDA